MQVAEVDSAHCIAAGLISGRYSQVSTKTLLYEASLCDGVEVTGHS